MVVVVVVVGWERVVSVAGSSLRSGVSQGLPASDSTHLVKVVFSGNVHTNRPPALAPRSCRPTCRAPALPWRLPGKQGAASTQAHMGSPVVPEPNSSITLHTTCYTGNRTEGPIILTLHLGHISVGPHPGTITHGLNCLEGGQTQSQRAHPV